MADCVIHVDQRVTAQITTRRLRVIKYRGSGYGRNEYPFIINEDGINIVPITSNVLQHRAPGPRVSSGAAWVDGVLGGGLQARDQHSDRRDRRRGKDHDGLRVCPGRVPPT
jgi:circadian clock protein KaiC